MGNPHTLKCSRGGNASHLEATSHISHIVCKLPKNIHIMYFTYFRCLIHGELPQETKLQPTRPTLFMDMTMQNWFARQTDNGERRLDCKREDIQEWSPSTLPEERIDPPHFFAMDTHCFHHMKEGNWDWDHRNIQKRLVFFTL